VRVLGSNEKMSSSATSLAMPAGAVSAGDKVQLPCAVQSRGSDLISMPALLRGKLLGPA
jgi:hypothetical protein